MQGGAFKRTADIAASVSAGDFSSTGGIRAQSSPWGRTLLMFKKPLIAMAWLGFGKGRLLATGTNIKKRAASGFTPELATIMGYLLALPALGPVGAIGGAALLGTVSFAGRKKGDHMKQLHTVKAYAVLLTNIVLRTMSMPVNMIISPFTGTRIKGINYEKTLKLDKEDASRVRFAVGMMFLLR